MDNNSSIRLRLRKFIAERKGHLPEDLHQVVLHHCAAITDPLCAFNGSDRLLDAYYDFCCACTALEDAVDKNGRAYPYLSRKGQETMQFLHCWDDGYGEVMQFRDYVAAAIWLRDHPK